MVLAKLMQELQRHTEQPFELVFLVMDPGYAPANRALIEENAARLGIPITVFRSDIFDVAYQVEKNPCYLCARMRRGFLYSKAQELGCNKIALGHHLSDVLETTLLGLFYGAQLQTMPPKLRSRNFPGMELIRPLYCVHEDAIIAWKNYNGLRFLQCACRFTEERDGAADGVGESKRQEMKLLLRELKRPIPTLRRACSGPFTASSWTRSRASNSGAGRSRFRRPTTCGAPPLRRMKRRFDTEEVRR